MGRRHIGRQKCLCKPQQYPAHNGSQHVAVPAHNGAAESLGSDHRAQGGIDSVYRSDEHAGKPGNPRGNGPGKPCGQSYINAAGPCCHRVHGGGPHGRSQRRPVHKEIEQDHENHRCRNAEGCLGLDIKA